MERISQLLWMIMGFMYVQKIVGTEELVTKILELPPVLDK
jgi:hypothetical protein